MIADNSTLEELETAAHKVFAQRMEISTAITDLRKLWDEIQEVLPDCQTCECTWNPCEQSSRFHILTV